MKQKSFYVIARKCNGGGGSVKTTSTRSHPEKCCQLSWCLHDSLSLLSMVIVIFLLYLCDLKRVIHFTSCLKTLLQNMDELLDFRNLFASTLFLLTKAVDQ